MSPLSVVSDFIVSLVSDPIGHWSVLLYLFPIHNLLPEGLLRALRSMRLDQGLPFPLLLLLFNK